MDPKDRKLKGSKAKKAVRKDNASDDPASDKRSKAKRKEKSKKQKQKELSAKERRASSEEEENDEGAAGGDTVRPFTPPLCTNEAYASSSRETPSQLTAGIANSCSALSPTTSSLFITEWSSANFCAPNIDITKINSDDAASVIDTKSAAAAEHGPGSKSQFLYSLVNRLHASPDSYLVRLVKWHMSSTKHQGKMARHNPGASGDEMIKRGEGGEDGDEEVVMQEEESIEEETPIQWFTSEASVDKEEEEEEKATLEAAEMDVNHSCRSLAVSPGFALSCFPVRWFCYVLTLHTTTLRHGSRLLKELIPS